ncbi:caspase recruitment domain-containing protein 19-like isoform X2 [Cololabis saira]|uniref:caspase recruitment domain-containing protein 19-like isoform X2 n=1 Tax=Cololabis saira TaxID=129043 RepID=UPI002AD4C47D|nr:caspase recruitment domain-containing protein 19-like isoform X2 [Cololabis saira]
MRRCEASCCWLAAASAFIPGPKHPGCRDAFCEARMAPLRAQDAEGYDEQLQTDTQFLCSDQRVDAELVDRLVLQLNRIYPQILSDKEACKFRRLSVPIKVRLPQLLKYLCWKGEEACHEFYRALHLHAEDIYSSLPTRAKLKEMTDDSEWTHNVAALQDRYVLNDKGPMFFLSCFSFVVGIAFLYYYREGQTLRCTGDFLHCSAARLSKNVLEVGKQK